MFPGCPRILRMPTDAVEAIHPLMLKPWIGHVEVLETGARHRVQVVLELERLEVLQVADILVLHGRCMDTNAHLGQVTLDLTQRLAKVAEDPAHVVSPIFWQSLGSD